MCLYDYFFFFPLLHSNGQHRFYTLLIFPLVSLRNTATGYSLQFGCNFDFMGFYWAQLIVLGANFVTARRAYLDFPRASPTPPEPTEEEAAPCCSPHTLLRTRWRIFVCFFTFVVGCAIFFNVVAASAPWGSLFFFFFLFSQNFQS